MTRPGRVVAFGIIIAAVSAGWIVYGSDPVSGRLTSYSATCLQRGLDNRCRVVGRTLDPAVFQVSVARQQVDVLGDDGERRQLRACEVTSRKTWHCRSTDDSIELGFTDGEPWLKGQGSAGSDLAFLPRWRYLWLKSGEPHRALWPARFQFRR